MRSTATDKDQKDLQRSQVAAKLTGSTIPTGFMTPIATYEGHSVTKLNDSQSEKTTRSIECYDAQTVTKLQSLRKPTKLTVTHKAPATSKAHSKLQRLRQDQYGAMRSTVASSMVIRYTMLWLLDPWGHNFIIQHQLIPASLRIPIPDGAPITFRCNVMYRGVTIW